MAALRILALLTMIGSCHCEPPNCSYWRLWEHLNLTTSNSFVANVRPVESWKTTTMVAIDMVVYGILKVDEKSQTVEGATWTTVRWRNQFIKWNPKDFCGIEAITVPRSMVWIPDLYIEEDVSDTSSTQNSPFVNLQANGVATATVRRLMTFTCQLNVNLFPFDEQNCSITFGSMSSDGLTKNLFFAWMASVMTLTSLSSGTQLTNKSISVILTQGEWELTDITITKDISPNAANITLSKLIYNVVVSRRPMLYVINFIVPLLFFLILDLASFFINEAGGEKLSFKVTILLSISVLLLILKDMLPSTEIIMPWIANYALAIFALVGISVLETMTISFLLSFEEKVKEKPQTSLGSEEDIQLERANFNNPAVLLTVSGDLAKGSPLPVSASMEFGVLRQILFEIKTTREELNLAKVPKTRPRFKTIALIIDIVFFVLYLTTVIVFLSYAYDSWAKRYIQD